MSLWQYAACVDGFRAYNSPDAKPEPMSDEAFDDLLERNADWIAKQSKAAPHAQSD